MSRKQALGAPDFSGQPKPKPVSEQSKPAYEPPRDEHFLPIGRKIEDMMNIAFGAIEQMPRAQKPIIGKIIEAFMWELLDLVTSAGRGFYKAKTLETAIVKLDLLRSAVRSADSRKIISHSIYKKWVVANNDIGRDLGAWYKQDKESKEKLSKSKGNK